jgi:hypothetical protein
MIDVLHLQYPNRELSSERFAHVGRIETVIVTFRSAFYVYMKILVSAQRLLEYLYLLCTFRLSCGGVCSTFPVSFHLVKLYHLLNALQVLLFHIQLEFQL